jgi:hypothetical protein
LIVSLKLELQVLFASTNFVVRVKGEHNVAARERAAVNKEATLSRSDYALRKKATETTTKGKRRRRNCKVPSKRGGVLAGHKNAKQHCSGRSGL